MTADGPGDSYLLWGGKGRLGFARIRSVAAAVCPTPAMLDLHRHRADQPPTRRALGEAADLRTVDEVDALRGLSSPAPAENASN